MKTESIKAIFRCQQKNEDLFLFSFRRAGGEISKNMIVNFVFLWGGIDWGKTANWDGKEGFFEFICQVSLYFDKELIEIGLDF